MSFINDKSKEINCKIVYCGPALSGKSTTLRSLCDQIRSGSRGEMTSIAQEDDRTLYFDFVPLTLGKVRGYTVRLHLYTVPGEVGYQQSRALIAKGVDGVVFVADSQLTRMDENLKSLTGLKEILRSEGHTWEATPIAFQYNKRDLGGTVAPEQLRAYLNAEGRPEFETVATKGQGVFDAFQAISTLVLKDLKQG